MQGREGNGQMGGDKGGVLLAERPSRLHIIYMAPKVSLSSPSINASLPTYMSIFLIPTCPPQS